MTDSSDISEAELERRKRVADRPAADVEGHKIRADRNIEAPDQDIGVDVDETLDRSESDVEGHGKYLRH